MPIYAYSCAACGRSKDVLQKISDPLLTRCPACGKDALVKQVTAAGFQLKGAGWYVTDFRDASKRPSEQRTAATEQADSGARADAKVGSAEAVPSPAASSAPASST